MSKIRVLIVDDGVVIRRMVSDCLAADPEIEVAGTAANGQIGLAKIGQLNPDLVTLDIEMPVMDGLQMLATLRRTHPRLPVILFSTLTERGADTTLDALALGASDYVTKPANMGSVGASVQRIREELIPKIKALCGRNPPQAEFTPRRAPAPSPASASAAAVEIVAIGVSTGGPNALATLLSGLARSFPVPVVIVQHMPALFTRMLAERLSSVSGFPVREGRDGAPLRPGEMWVAPGGLHMETRKTEEGAQLCLHEGPPENSCRPAVDVLFRSVAHQYGARALGIVLTGMGQDGLRGCESIREAGGQILVQDEATSVVWGMPGAVSQAGLAHSVLPLPELAVEINRRVRPGACPAETPKPTGSSVVTTP
jgi:two-component system chemotaxis response regulator CheB